MPLEYSLSDAQKMLGTDNKMLQKWIADAVRSGEAVRPHLDPHNQSRKLLTRRQVERLAELHGRTLPPEKPAPAADPLSALEQRLRRYIDQQIAALEARLAAGQKPPAEHTPVRAPEARQTASLATPVSQHPSPKPSSPERILFATFLRAHFAEEDETAAYQVADSILSPIQRHQPISTSNRARLIRAWRELPGFTICGREGCPCGD